MRGSPISNDDFINRYRNKFPPDQLGLLSIDKFCDIVRDLKLCGSISAIRDTGLARKAFLEKQSSGIFLLSERNSEGGHLFHTRLVLAAGNFPVAVGQGQYLITEAFRLYSVFQDGSETEDWVPVSDLERQLPHFLILQP